MVDELPDSSQVEWYTLEEKKVYEFVLGSAVKMTSCTNEAKLEDVREATVKFEGNIRTRTL